MEGRQLVLVLLKQKACAEAEHHSIGEISRKLLRGLHTQVHVSASVRACSVSSVSSVIKPWTFWNKLLNKLGRHRQECVGYHTLISNLVCGTFVPHTECHTLSLEFWGVCGTLEIRVCGTII